jgi:hypothetical protein
MVKITGDVARRRLGNVPDERMFVCYRGRLVRNLKELAVVLGDDGHEIYTHHCADGKNDFSQWVRYVIGDEKLAQDLDMTTNLDQALKLILARIDFLENKLSQVNER